LAIPNTRYLSDLREININRNARGRCPTGSGSAREQRKYETVTCDRQRPKPAGLGYTPCTYISQEDRPFGFLECSTHPGQLNNQYYEGDIGYCHPLISGVNRSFSSEGSSSIDEARLRATARLTGFFANYGESLGEINQTSRMIANRIQSITSLARDIRKRDVKSLKNRFGNGYRVLKNPKTGSNILANNWLEYSFGWRPLVSDIWAGIEFLSKRLEAGSDVSSSANSAQGGFGPKGVNSASTAKRLEKFGANARFTISGKVTNARIANLNAMGLLNPLAIAWDLMPFSFVVDWVLPIGPWLASLSATAGLSEVKFCHTTEKVTYVDRTNLPCHPYIQNMRRTVKRTPTSGSFNFPGITAYRSDIRKVVTTTALLVQQFGR